MGFSVGKLSSTAKAGYLLGAFVIIFGILLLGLRYVFTEKAPLNKRKSKAKKN